MKDLKVESNEPLSHNNSNSNVSLLESIGVEELNHEANDVASVKTDDNDRSEEEVEKCKSIVSGLTDWEKKRFTDPNMPLRYLTAEKGNTETATKRIKETIAWREEFKVSSIKQCFEENGDSELKEIITFENSTSKIYCRGYDKEDRAILYLRPARENSSNGQNNMRHLVYHLEKAIASSLRKSKGKQDKVNIIVDYLDFRFSHTPSISTTKMTLNILQNHYPERLHKGYICNPPRVFVAFWKLIQPFLDPRTKKKIIFCKGEHGKELLAEDIDLNVVEKKTGGCNNGKEFDSKEYLYGPFDQVFDEK